MEIYEYMKNITKWPTEIDKNICLIVSNAKTIYILFYGKKQFAIKLAQHLYEIPVQWKLYPPLILDFVAA